MYLSDTPTPCITQISLTQGFNTAQGKLRTSNKINSVNALCIPHWSKSLVVSPESVQGFRHQKLLNFLMFLRIRELPKWTSFCVMIHKLKNAENDFYYLTTLISSTRTNIYIEYEIMKINSTSNATKSKQIFFA